MSGAISRTVQPGLPLGQAPRGALAAQIPLVFPNKNAGETLDYAVDFSAELEGGVTTTLTNPTIAISPAGQLVASNQAVNGLVVSFDLAGGQPGQAYVVSVAANGAGPMQVGAFVAIYVLPLANAVSEAVGDSFINLFSL